MNTFRPSFSIAFIAIGIFSSILFLAANCEDTDLTTTLTSDCSGRYANFAGPVPPKSQYKGSLYTLGQNWPTTLPAIPTDAPWLKYDSITNDNMLDYMYDMRAFILNQMIPADFRMNKVDWYAIPFQGREAIRGMYDGNNQPPQAYDPQQIEEAINFTTEFYSNRGGYTIGQVFGQCDRSIYDPNVTAESVLFPEGTVVIKLAMTSLSDKKAPIMKGAFQWDIYADSVYTTSQDVKKFNPKVIPVKLIQMDIILKDSRLAPETGWVFGTLAYDSNAEAVGWNGADDKLKGLYKMIPLGAMTGMDPGVVVNLDTTTSQLKETFINPDAPAYCMPLLGWGRRLSGPIDGAQGFSSCMGCHGTSQWNTKDWKANLSVFDDINNAPLFIPPGNNPAKEPDSVLLAYTRNLPGSKGWCNTSESIYFTTMGCPDLKDGENSDWIGLDYDFVMFKGILNANLDGKKIKRPKVKAYH